MPTDKSLKDAIEKLTKAEKLLKPSSWSTEANRARKSVALLDQVLSDPDVPGDLKIFVEQSKLAIAAIGIARTGASTRLTAAIFALQAKLALVRAKSSGDEP